MARGASTRTGYDANFGYNLETPDWLNAIGGPAFNPQQVGSDIGQYYTAAMAEQPGYAAILRNIKGVLSPEATYAIGQGAAERGIGIGSYGGANDATALLRALGTSSQALTNLGLQQYGAAYSAVPTLQPTSTFVTPTDRSNMLLQWRMQQERLAQAAAEAEADRRLREKLSRWGIESEQSQFWGRLNAEERWAQANQAATEAYRQDQLARELGNLTAQLGGGYSGGVLGGYGTRTEAPVATEPPWYQMSSFPIVPGGGEGGGSGSIYSGQAPSNQADLERVLWGEATPSDLGLEGIYQQGPAAQEWNAWLDEGWGYM